MSPTTTYHYHLDHLGTPRLVTKEFGVLVGQHTYYPFGAEMNLTPTESATELMKFTGHERDIVAATNGSVDYMHARYYNGNLGRFLSVDPTWSSADLGQPQSWNRYAYVENNPVGKVDPDGRCGWGVLLGPIGCVGEDYIRERGPQVIEAAKGMGRGASGKERLMGAAVIGIVALDIAGNFVEPGEGEAVEAAVREGGEILSRRTVRESLTRLARKSAEAEASNIRIHGVSATAAADSSAVTTQARSEVEQVF
jgi:RHS repeat-associated protein